MDQLIPGDSLVCAPKRSKWAPLPEALRKGIDRAEAVSETVHKRRSVDWRKPELPVWVRSGDASKSDVSNSQRRNMIR